MLKADCAPKGLCRVAAATAMLFAAWFAAPAAVAQDSGLERCRQIADPAQRLACYDALPRGTPEARPAAPAPAPAGARQAGAPPAQPKPAAEQFGLEEVTPPPQGLDKIDTRVMGKFEGWWPNAKIALANGQVWQVADGSSRVYELDSPKVTIARGALGTYYLNVDGQNWTVRVRRVQ
jgi:hypothetical protein